jgi:hypothetical protein
VLAEQFRTAAAAARNTHAVDEIARLTWRAHAEGRLADAEAEAVGVALQARRSSFAVRRTTPSTRAALGLPRTARRDPRSPDRQASIERRRRQAMSGIVPARIAASFTVGENAALSVIARQCQRSGVCSLPIDAIAALAGVCRTVVKSAMREAKLIGLIHVKERRVPGRKSLPNIVRVISREWLAWLKLSIGVRFPPSTRSHSINPASSRPSSPAQRGIRGGKSQAPCQTLSG